jgi:hypothetical protein
MKTEFTVSGISGKGVYDFMINCTDKDYQRWWPGTHFAFHTIKRFPSDEGNLVYFDEYVGRRRLKFNAVVTELDSGKRLVWQMVNIVRLPEWLSMELEETDGGVKFIQSLIIGFRGIGRIFDSILRLYFSNAFQKDLELHARMEFQKLAELLAL